MRGKERESTLAALTTEDERLLSYLRERWSELLHLTTVEQGMVALDQATDVDQRQRLGDHLVTHPELHPGLERWGPRTFVLTEEEKLLGRYLTQRATGDRGDVSVAEAAAAIDGTPADAERALRILQHFDLLGWRRLRGAISYRLAANWQKLAGPLGFTFHTIRRQGGERFNVP